MKNREGKRVSLHSRGSAVARALVAVVVWARTTEAEIFSKAAVALFQRKSRAGAGVGIGGKIGRGRGKNARLCLALLELLLMLELLLTLRARRRASCVASWGGSRRKANEKSRLLQALRQGAIVVPVGRHVECNLMRQSLEQHCDNALFIDPGGETMLINTINHILWRKTVHSHQGTAGFELLLGVEVNTAQSVKKRVGVVPVLVVFVFIEVSCPNRSVAGQLIQNGDYCRLRREIEQTEVTAHLGHKFACVAEVAVKGGRGVELRSTRAIEEVCGIHMVVVGSEGWRDRCCRRSGLRGSVDGRRSVGVVGINERNAARWHG